MSRHERRPVSSSPSLSIIMGTNFDYFFSVGGVGQETTVFDSSALWIFSMIRSVASVAMPTSLQLRDTLLRQSRRDFIISVKVLINVFFVFRLAVNGMPPLSIAPASSERPALLSESILNEVNDFLENLLQLALEPTALPR